MFLILAFFFIWELFFCSGGYFFLQRWLFSSVCIFFFHLHFFLPFAFFSSVCIFFFRLYFFLRWAFFLSASLSIWAASIYFNTSYIFDPDLYPSSHCIILVQSYCSTERPIYLTDCELLLSYLFLYLFYTHKRVLLRAESVGIDRVLDTRKCWNVWVETEVDLVNFLKCEKWICWIFFELFCLKWVRKHLNVDEQPVSSMRWAGDFFELRRGGVDLCYGENDKNVRYLFCVELFFFIIFFFVDFFFVDFFFLKSVIWMGVIEVILLKL